MEEAAAGAVVISSGSPSTGSSSNYFFLCLDLFSGKTAGTAAGAACCGRVPEFRVSGLKSYRWEEEEEEEEEEVRGGGGKGVGVVQIATVLPVVEVAMNLP